MNHEELKILISAYYDGEATAPEKARVEAHLKECSECRKYAEGLRRLSSTLKDWSDEALSPDVSQKIHRAMEKPREGTTMYTSKKVAVTLVMFVVVGIVAFSVNQKAAWRQATQGRLRSATDDIGKKYDPYYLRSDHLQTKEVQPPAPTQLAALPAAADANLTGESAGALASGIYSAPQEVQKRAAGGFQEQSYDAVVQYPAAVATSGLRAQAGMAMPQYDQVWEPMPPRSYPYVYPTPPVPTGTEQYDYIQENQFLDATQNPLSTLSIDVDTASYSNIRRFLNQGQLPPPDAVRIEEMVNYFTYDYPQPSWGKPFSITTEVSPCPWSPSRELVMVGIQGKTLQANKIPPSNLVFLIDVSGSMADANRLPLVKEGFKMLANNLRPEDRVSIVVYAGAAGVVLDSVSGGNKYEIISALDRLQAGGSTAGGQGIQLAYQLAQRNFIRNGNNRVILATDGDFNVGISGDNELVRLIEEKRQQGVYLTVLGFGMGNYKDGKMEKLADKGNGNYAYIDTLNEAKKVMVNELGSMLFTIAKDVKIQIEFNPQAVKSYRLIGYENRIMAKEDFNDDTKDAGELGAGHTVTALYEIVPAGSHAFTPHNEGKVDELKYQTVKVKRSNDLMTVKLRYKEPNSHVSQLISQTVNRPWMQWAPTSDNFKFASAVAEFGLLLRDSQYKGHASYTGVISRVQQTFGNDPYGYRQEFLGLVGTAQSLDHRQNTPNYYYPQPVPEYDRNPIQFKGE